MTTTTENLVALTPGGDITEEMLAGYYLIYSIAEQSVPLTRVRKAFKDNGLDVSRLPEARRPEHVMMDACTKAEHIGTQGGTREEIRAQQVGRDANFVIYQMTRHVHDLENRVIEHPKALRVIFAFEDASLTFEPLEGASMVDVQELADEIQEYFDTHQQMLPGRGLRTIIRHYIEAAGGEFLRDGAYFLPKATRLTQTSKLREHHGERIEGAWFIEAIQNALRYIYKTEPEFHPIPCINDEGQRAFLKRKFIENCAEDLKGYRDECLELVKDKQDGQRVRAIRTDKRSRMVERRKEIEARRQQFAEILGETLEELDQNMALADRALAQFLREADA